MASAGELKTRDSGRRCRGTRGRRVSFSTSRAATAAANDDDESSAGTQGPTTAERKDRQPWNRGRGRRVEYSDIAAPVQVGRRDKDTAVGFRSNSGSTRNRGRGGTGSNQRSSYHHVDVASMTTTTTTSNGRYIEPRRRRDNGHRSAGYFEDRPRSFKPKGRVAHRTSACPFEAFSDGNLTRETQDQTDEFMALASIYDQPDQFSVVEETFGGRFCAFVDVPQPFFVLSKKLVQTRTPNSETTGTASDVRADEFQRISVKYLPPITLHFNLPPDYPSTRQPRFRLSCMWLSTSQLTCLSRCLDDIWDEDTGEVVLFKWTVFLKEDSLNRLSVRDTLDLSWMLETASSARTGTEMDPETRGVTRLATLLPEIVEYDERRREEVFRLQFFKCDVCFDERIGAKCMRFKGCEHTFCRDCMQSYFEVQIRDGNVKRLCCPTEKCPSLALPLQVRDLVSAELYAKYDRLLLASTLDSMSDVAYCPRESCQCAVLLESGSELASCPSCHFAFCTFCLMAYHGIEPCKFKSEERLLLYNKYTNGDEAERTRLEARYGRRQLKRLVEATMSDTWLQENSKCCPKCKAQIEKVDGCNKMTCWKCNSYFCWLCMQRLDPANPYRHYDGRGTGGCFGLLFQGAFDGDDEDFIDLEDEDFDDADSDASEEF